jgi:hypothetical protein
MSDDLQKISVQIPADTLKEISAETDKVKAAEGKTLVTLQFSPETVDKLKTLREDITAFQQTQVTFSNAEVDRLIKTSEMRTGFYEKLILLAGGSFALSLAFLGYLHRATLHTSPLAAMARLKAAWILLLVCIVLSWLHNLHRYAAVERATLTNANLIASIHGPLTYSHGPLPCFERQNHLPLDSVIQ